MKLSDFDFLLPDRLIAQHPLPERDSSRMMVVRRSSGTVAHRFFRELPDLLEPEQLLVLNHTRVIPARLRARRPGQQEQIEILLIQQKEEFVWRALVRPARKAVPGRALQVRHLTADVLEIEEDGSRILRFQGCANLAAELEKIGSPPLPPYIRRNHREDLSEDKARYQTVYARHSGSVAAPTAGLHFTREIIDRLSKHGVQMCEILLHVGYGTFKPVRCEEVADHRMEPEYFEVGDDAAQRIAGARAAGRRLVAVGSTVTRVLEHLGKTGWEPGTPASGYSSLFIYPGHQFCMIDALLTNFHLPRSTLFMMVCAFAGLELMRDCYRQAIREGYRFFSYGDCMLIL